MAGGKDNVRQHDKVGKFKVRNDILLDVISKLNNERTKNSFIDLTFVKIDVVEALIIVQVIGILSSGMVNRLDKIAY